MQSHFCHSSIYSPVSSGLPNIKVMLFCPHWLYRFTHTHWPFIVLVISIIYVVWKLNFQQVFKSRRKLRILPLVCVIPQMRANGLLYMQKMSYVCFWEGGGVASYLFFACPQLWLLSSFSVCHCKTYKQSWLYELPEGFPADKILP